MVSYERDEILTAVVIWERCGVRKPEKEKASVGVAHGSIFENTLSNKKVTCRRVILREGLGVTAACSELPRLDLNMRKIVFTDHIPSRLPMADGEYSIFHAPLPVVLS